MTSEEIRRQKAFVLQIREAVEARQSPLFAYVDTYGCQQNESDSEKLRGMLLEMGYGLTQDEFEADVIVINTCAIRENAENRALGNIGALIHTKRAKPSQIIAVCGCLAGVRETVMKLRGSYEHVSLVFPPNALWRFPELLYAAMLRGTYAYFADGVKEDGAPQPEIPHGSTLKRIFVTESVEGAIIEGIPSHRDMKIRAWLPVMYGCDNYCSYCIVPYVRGRERSRAPDAIVDEARVIVSAGYKDITMLGQNVNSYRDGASGKDSFAALIRRVNDINGEFLIRFMTSHPKDASDGLFRAMSECDKAARHIHLPFQAGSDRVLSLMNRGYTQAEYLERVAAARSFMPEIALTSDAIVGFPGETESDFEETLRLVEKAQFDSLFIFIYSGRPGTPAARLEDATTREEKQARFDRLNDLQNSISKAKHAQFVGKKTRVLVDTQSRDARYPLKARTNGGRLVHLLGEADLLGSFVEARITHCNSWSLFGEVW